MQNINDEQFQTGKDQYLVYHLQQDKQDIIQQPILFTPIAKEIPKLQLKINEISTNFTPPKHEKETEIQEIKPVKFKNQYYFSKDFESGNLNSVQRLNNNTYLLKLSVDSNSKKQCQWFYFSCLGISEGNFILTGFRKSDSLFNYGMKICVNENNVWKRGGENISYSFHDESNTYCLKFSYKFQDPSKKVYFAYSYPYTYTQLKQYLSYLEKKKLQYVKIEIIAKTLLKNNIYCINIGNLQSKDVIVITARVHPGESLSSYILKGLVDKLIQKNKQCTVLREKFLFKIFPMLNPDGVILGNYRFSYAGHDLNRKWKQPSSKLHPQIYHLRKIIIETHKSKRIAMLLDIHGHSRKKNIFFYGCFDKSKQNSLIVKQFPFLMSKIDKNYKYQNCCFAIQQSKQGTQRIFMYNNLKIPQIYTIQSSFCGNEENNDNYNVANLQNLGTNLLKGIVIYHSQEILKTKKFNNKAQIEVIESLVKEKKNILEQFYKNKQYHNNVGMIGDEGSDSAPSDGCQTEQFMLNLLKLNTNITVPTFSTSNNNLIKRSHRQCKLRPLTSKNCVSSNTMIQCKANLINGQIFNKSTQKKKILKSQFEFEFNNTTQQKQIQSPRRQFDCLFSPLKKQKKNHYQSILNDRDQGTQYKRIKNYAQKLMRQSKLKQQRSLQLRNKSNTERQVVLQKKMSTHKKQSQFQILKINQTNFNFTAVTTPIFSSQKKKIQNLYIPTGYFNISIKARDYIQQKRNLRSPAARTKRMPINNNQS